MLSFEQITLVILVQILPWTLLSQAMLSVAQTKVKNLDSEPAVPGLNSASTIQF